MFLSQIGLYFQESKFPGCRRHFKSSNWPTERRRISLSDWMYLLLWTWGYHSKDRNSRLWEQATYQAQCSSGSQATFPYSFPHSFSISGELDPLFLWCFQIFCCKSRSLYFVKLWHVCIYWRLVVRMMSLMWESAELKISLRFTCCWLGRNAKHPIDSSAEIVGNKANPAFSGLLVKLLCFTINQPERRLNMSSWK